MGVPGEDIASDNDEGAVNVIYGSATGLTATGNQLWHQNSSGIQGDCGRADTFGRALAAGDFDGDGYADLAVGVPNDDWSSLYPGAVNLLYGSASGLTATGNQY